MASALRDDDQGGGGGGGDDDDIPPSVHPSVTPLGTDFYRLRAAPGGRRGRREQ